jgi:hypothetical protein
LLGGTVKRLSPTLFHGSRPVFSMSNVRRNISVAAAVLALWAGFPHSIFGQATPAQTFTWPGQMTGPKSLWVAQATIIMHGTFGHEAEKVALAAEDSPSITETNGIDGIDGIDDNQVKSNTRQIGRTIIKTTHSSHGGHVVIDMEIISNDSYTNAATGTALGSQHSTALGHFDVTPCPEVDGVAGGHVSIQLRQETTLPDRSRSSSTALAEGPFRFVNGDDAYRVRTELNLTVTAGSLRTGPAADPSDPVAWGLSVPINLSWADKVPAAASVGPESSVSWAGDFPNTGLADSPADSLAIMIVTYLEKEVETFWRSGKCIKLKPSEKSREVNPQEKIELTVESEHHFDQKEVKTPIKAQFTGVKSIDPQDKPVDEPAKFDFVAGEKRGDQGVIELTQTGKRGIGRESVTFTVKPPALALSCDGSFSLSGLGNRFDGHLQISEAQLKFQEDGTYRGTGNMKVSGPFTSGDDKCHADINYMNPVELLAKVDPKDASIVRVQITPTYVNYSTTCTPGPTETAGAWRRSTNKFSPYLALDLWGRMMANRKLTFFKATTFNDSLAQGAETNTSTTLTMTYSDGLKP